jgi:hypothetical protein
MTIIMGKKKLNWVYILQARSFSWYLLNYLATQKKTYPFSPIQLGTTRGTNPLSKSSNTKDRGFVNWYKKLEVSLSWKTCIRHRDSLEICPSKLQSCQPTRLYRLIIFALHLGEVKFFYFCSGTETTGTHATKNKMGLRKKINKQNANTKNESFKNNSKRKMYHLVR